ncbi:VOC family protein [Halomonas elongata]|uniref:VOC family protein n=1 Tax=Halomonas elongata TaxID=2746 RepID=UPI003364FF92
MRCQEPATSKQFYELLGFRFVEERHGDGPIHYASQVASMVFELYPLREGESVDNTRLGFSVPDLGEIVANLETVSRHARADEVVYIAQDPDGRKIELTERMTSPSTPPHGNVTSRNSDA